MENTDMHRQMKRESECNYLNLYEFHLSQLSLYLRNNVQYWLKIWNHLLQPYPIF